MKFVLNLYTIATDASASQATSKEAACQHEDQEAKQSCREASSYDALKCSAPALAH